ncbi:hypothetical protein BDW22DRAFT_1400046 [Trametopsis cervina]|nr:hypothetical protein BDW22DRAFT_1400046 [Trametopsis cervina]
MSGKRPRTPSNNLLEAPSQDQDLYQSAEPVSKAKRTNASQATLSDHPLLCTLPPTCNPPNRPTPLLNSKELESHYATYHAHVCEEGDCGCVFPDAKLLELHQTECHDPIAALRKERGEKIFACHLPTCTRMFGSPKTRRLHLIQAHGYPKEYFFAVTNKGVGGLLKKWGEGASMIRGSWSARDGPHSEEEGDSDEGSNAEDKEEERDYTLREDSGARTSSRLDEGPLIEDDDDTEEIGVEPDESLDDLAASMDTLSLVPPTIRFGRGAKHGSVSHHVPSGSGRRGRHSSKRVDGQARMDVDNTAGAASNPRGRGRSRRASQDVSRGQSRAGPPVPPRGLGAGRRGLAGRGRISIGHVSVGRGGTAYGMGRGN